VNSIEIKPLKKTEAIKFFKAIDKDGLLPDDNVLNKETIFEQRSNQELMDIYQNWRIQSSLSFQEVSKHITQLGQGKKADMR
jgi:hypothetical protein